MAGFSSLACTTSRTDTTNWHQAIMVYNATTNLLTIYYDGAVDCSQTQTADYTSSDDKIWLGNRVDNGAGHYYDGSLDTVRIINGARSSAWVKAEYYSSTDGLVIYGSEQVMNNVPVINQVTTSPNITSVGTAVVFNASWTDSGDQTKLYVCKSNQLTGNSSCTGGSWCVNSSWVTDSPTVCSYTTGVSDVGTKNYYAFVCDDSSICSVSSSGSFVVNDTTSPSISAINITSYNQTTNFSWVQNDLSNINSSYVNITGSNGVVNKTLSASGNGTKTLTYYNNQLSPYSFYLRVNDSYGHVANFTVN